MLVYMYMYTCICIYMYILWSTNIAMENHHFERVISLILWSLSLDMLTYQLILFFFLHNMVIDNCSFCKWSNAECSLGTHEVSTNDGGARTRGRHFSQQLMAWLDPTHLNMALGHKWAAWRYLSEVKGDRWP